MSETMCPECQFDDHVGQALYCQECGTCLVNECTNDDCDSHDLEQDLELVPSNAKYCPHCGHETTYNANGFFE